jgi:hypothetical protein
MVTDGYANRVNGVDYNAVDERRFDSPLLMPGAGGGAFSAQSGRRVNGAGLVASVGGSPEAWTVTAGSGVIFDSAYASQGAYRFEIPNSVTAQLPARPGAGTSRIDLLVARIYDNVALGSGATEVKVERVNGTAGASPFAPSLPALSVELARLTVPASGTIVVTASTERTVAAGGVLPVPTTAAMDKLVTDGIAYAGLVVNNAQTNSLHRYTGTAWSQMVDGSTGLVAAGGYGVGWADLGGGETSQVQKTNGMVTLFLAATKGGGSNVAAEAVVRIADGYRPARLVRGWGWNASSPRPFQINTGGYLTVDYAQAAGLSAIVSTITYPAA